MDGSASGALRGKKGDFPVNRTDALDVAARLFGRDQEDRENGNNNEAAE